MNLELLPLEPKDLERFAEEMQKAFQLAIDTAGQASPLPVLPRKDIDKALANPKSVALVAWAENKPVGGAILFIDHQTKENECALFYVCADTQNKGLGAALWKAIEEQYPDTILWKLCTPYFETRNIHFYLKKCGFHIVDLVRDTEDSSEQNPCEWELMFEFLKRMDGCWE